MHEVLAVSANFPEPVVGFLPAGGQVLQQRHLHPPSWFAVVDAVFAG